MTELGASLIASGVNTAGSLIGGLFGQSQSQKAWRRQAEYNSPKNQMARLKEAGLNPNLVYGSGSVANTQSQPYETIKPDTGKLGSESIANYITLKQNKMQNDLMQKQMEFINAQIADKLSSINYRDNPLTNKTLSDTNYTQLVAEEKKKVLENFDTNMSLDIAGKRLRNDQSGLDIQAQKLMLKYYPQKLQNEILYSRAQIRNLDANTDKQKIESIMLNLAKEYRKNGIEVTDHLLMRQFSDIIKWGKDSWKELFKGWKF